MEENWSWRDQCGLLASPHDKFHFRSSLWHSYMAPGGNSCPGETVCGPVHRCFSPQGARKRKEGCITSDGKVIPERLLNGAGGRCPVGPVIGALPPCVRRESVCRIFLFTSETGQG
ncbi:hypothetical protein AVEN_146488-1 [Araneus ventricosus]|uniref:Uncharacterized protein n=1 Tax=Araneus ventricosus TaxID=182803 RepID=A0A4Y2V5K1_ARAVE|nr:hypothetical protein AVEN_146488-1 [Araneus ventricosus]